MFGLNVLGIAQVQSNIMSLAGIAISIGVLVGKPEETTTYLVVDTDPLQVGSEVDHRKSFGEAIRGM